MAALIVWLCGVAVGVLITYVVMDIAHDREWNREHLEDEPDA